MRTLSSAADDIEVGKRLKAIRTTTELSQREFGKLLGVSRSAYINYEQGNRELPTGLVRFLIKEFNVDSAWLILGPGRKPVYFNRPVIDIDLLTYLDSKLRDSLRENKIILDSKEHARVLILCYEHFSTQESVDETAIDLMLKMVA